ncbi:MAG: FHA domain-containing protein, partial [Verrucomicrobiota bacterium]
MAKLVAAGGHFVELTQAVNTVGSDASTTIPITADLGLEPVHFSIIVNGLDALVTPAAGALVLVNGSPVGSERKLNEGDKIQAGALELNFEPGPIEAIPPATQPEAHPEPAPLDEGSPVDTSSLQTDSTETSDPVGIEANTPEEFAPASVSDLFAEGPVPAVTPPAEETADKASSSTLAKAGIGLAIVAILAAVGILGWQNRGLASDLLVLL